MPAGQPGVAPLGVCVAEHCHLLHCHEPAVPRLEPHEGQSVVRPRAGSPECGISDFAKGAWGPPQSSLRGELLHCQRLLERYPGPGGVREGGLQGAGTGGALPHWRPAPLLERTLLRLGGAGARGEPHHQCLKGKGKGDTGREVARNQRSFPTTPHNWEVLVPEGISPPALEGEGERGVACIQRSLLQRPTTGRAGPRGNPTTRA
mmetsp:Transcript_10723/g.32209  ORF Transcript_10723/g.32209 Transcript_10723/m.32209 type:complete len:205 (-) Transcript_10723:914-1528(-)